MLDDLVELWQAAAIRQFIRRAYIFREDNPEAESSAVNVFDHASILLLEGLDWIPDIQCKEGCGGAYKVLCSRATWVHFSASWSYKNYKLLAVE